MTDPALYLTVALSALAGTAIVAVVGLKGFTAWLDLKRAELATLGEVREASPSTASRIEVADLKERLRKLEAIAAGVDL